MSFYEKIKILRTMLLLMGMAVFVRGADNIQQPQYSWIDILSGRARTKEEKRIAEKVKSRVDETAIKLRERERIEALAKNNLSVGERQELQEEILKNQQQAIESARKREKTTIEKEERKATKLAKKQEAEARAIRKSELRQKTIKKLTRHAPFQEDEYGYFESEQERARQKQREREKEKTELAILNSFVRNPEYEQAARKKLGKFARDEDVHDQAQALAARAYYADFDKREAQEQQEMALQQKQFWKDRRAEIQSVKQGVPAKLQSWLDYFTKPFGKKAAQVRTGIAQRSSEAATKEFTARELEREYRRRDYERQHPQDLDAIRKELTKKKINFKQEDVPTVQQTWVDYVTKPFGKKVLQSLTGTKQDPQDVAAIRKELTNKEIHSWQEDILPRETKVQAIARARLKKGFEAWEKENPMPIPTVSPTVPQKSLRERIANWWSSRNALEPLGGAGVR